MKTKKVIKLECQDCEWVEEASTMQQAEALVGNHLSFFDEGAPEEWPNEVHTVEIRETVLMWGQGYE